MTNPVIQRLKLLLAVLSVLLLPQLLPAAPPPPESFNENDLGHTLDALCLDLKKDYGKRVASEKLFEDQYRNQRREMVATMKKCNELALLLYSQKQDYTFDLTYALESVTNEYEDFTAHRLPYDRIVARLDWDIERYARLVESLRRIPPEIKDLDVVPDSLAYRNHELDSLDRARMPKVSDADLARIRAAIRERMKSDSLRQEDRPFVLSDEEAVNRDSCIFYASELLKLCAKNKARVIRDSTHYQRAYLRLKESYDYSQSRYKQLQNRIFIQGQTPYSKIISGFGRQWTRVTQEFREKYVLSPDAFEGVDDVTFNSVYRGPMLLVFLSFQIVILLLLVGVMTLLVRLAIRFIKPLKRLSLTRGQRTGIILLAAILINALINFIPQRPNNFIDSATSLFGTYLWLLAAVIAALLIRLKSLDLGKGLKLYAPILISAIVVIGMRIIFMPNVMMNLVFPPLLLIFTVWQLVACLKFGRDVPGIDRLFGWLTMAVLTVSLVVSVMGYIFFALIIMVWWFFQMATIHTLATLSYLLHSFRVKSMPRKVEAYRRSLTFVPESDRDNLLFGATWLYDLVKDVFIPVLAVMSIPLCMKFSLGVFDFTDLYKTIIDYPFVNLTNAAGNPALRLSLRGIVVAVSLFFVFRYANYAIYAIYQILRYSQFIKSTGRRAVRKNEINFSLAKSLINTLVWFTYIIIIVVMIKLPTSSLTIIAGGLSAGIGIALKDIINNFIYGIQLMSGRLRVGDWIECDGVRGRVTKIGYQSTEIETLDAAVQSFLNATLFGKNFTNLTRNHSYEFVKIVVGVSYGTDVEKVRQVLVDAMQVMRTKDAYGREVVNPDKGVYVVFEGFGDSSVDIAVKQYVLVAERIAYCDKSREVIYRALNDAGISIPFPQRDIHIIDGE